MMKNAMKIVILVALMFVAANQTSYAEQTEFGPIEVKVHVRNNVKPYRSLRGELFKEETSEKSNIIKTAPSFPSRYPIIAGENVLFVWITIPPFFYPNPINGGTYRYTIAGVDSEGKIGPFSKEGVISIIKNKPASSISCKFEMKASKPILTLNWEAPSPYSVNYGIIKAENIEGPWKYIDSIKETKYIDTDLSEDGFHNFYKIKASGKFDHFPESDILEVKYK
jgi:hypothetical protein